MKFPTLPAPIQSALDERGYETATPVQGEVLRPDAAGRDLVVSAQTGSGKTVAFGIAMAAQLLNDKGRADFASSPRALVIAPTRELALQVSRELAWLYERTGARIATCVGGMNISSERRALSSGPTIVVGTPGRLRDHLERRALDLSQLSAVVLDEADEMLDMGFREELEAILDATPQSRRTLLFSATMPRPIEHLARRYQNDALRITTTSQGNGHSDISYQAVSVAPSEIENAVINLLRFHEAETAILFCGTREKVRQFDAALRKRGFASVALSGEHSQTERNHALQALRDGRARVCVATDVAARGIDLPTLSLVIHAEIPRDAESLQHRSGRTGRAGRKGVAVLIVPHSRRRRVEGMLRQAQIAAHWHDAPDAKAIRAKDRERLTAKLLGEVEIADADREIARQLLAQRSAEDIAAMLVQSHRTRLPEPMDLSANTAEGRQKAKQEQHRPGFEDTVWFRMDIGRRNNADPRWILPVLCRRGEITRNEIGAIRVGQAETFFQIPRKVADTFASAVVRTAKADGEEGSISIERSEQGPREMAKVNRRARTNGQAFHKPKHKGKRPAAKQPRAHHQPRAKAGEGKPAKQHKRKQR